MTDLKITKDNNYICVYERLNDNCIRLLHMYGKNPVCVVPDMLDGMSDGACGVLLFFQEYA